MSMVWGVSEAGLWRYAVLNFLALIYFYIRWSSRNAQHRMFHFLLMWLYLITTLFYLYQLWVGTFMKNAIGVSPWWYQLIDNILFELGLILIFVYALLFRRAQKDKGKYRTDVEGWFKKAGAAKKSVKGLVDGNPSKTDED